MEIITTGKPNANVATVERIASVIAGGALAYYGLKRRSPAGVAMAALGGDLLRRGATGHSYFYRAFGVRTAPKNGASVSVPYEQGIRVDRSLTVNQPREEVFRFWRDLENLPRFMQHLECVKVIDGRRSHWVALAPAGRTVEWDAEIINEIENELIGWRSLEGSGVDNAGSVHFADAPGGRGTRVKVELQYNPPGGPVGAAIAKLFGREPGRQVEEDLRRFKSIMEAGEIPTTEGQPEVIEGKPAIRKTRKSRARDHVHSASEDSFPASDAPAWSR